jgi:hypothetical protein
MLLHGGDDGDARVDCAKPYRGANEDAAVISGLERTSEHATTGLAGGAKERDGGQAVSPA